MVLSRLERFRSYEAIVAKVKALIDAGDLKPGDRLPPERELAAVLGTSRPTVREACRVLEHMGLLDSRIGSGRYIKAPPVPLATAGEGDPGEAEGAALLDYLAMRKIVEVPVAALAARNAGEADLASLKKAADMIADGVTEPLAADLSFHLAVAEASGNSFVVQMMRTGLFHLYRSATRTTALPGRRAQVTIEHTAIFDAIVARDPERARTLMQEHLDGAEAALRAGLAQAGKMAPAAVAPVSPRAARKAAGVE